ncbi:MAG TPA: DNA polymerase III subunit delta [Firmicutes bacterium]|nr:DNA polymerase III subunit delta [Bacillota bacterium]HBX25401.1 DNA polymerase III subunit delta [Bacillota bacterium]
MVILYYSIDSKMASSLGRKLSFKLEPNRNECNYSSFNMAMTSLNELYEECVFMPLGYEKKTILADGCYFLAKTKSKPKLLPLDSYDKMLSYLNNPSEQVNLILTCQAEKLDEKNPLVVAIKKVGTIKEITLPKMNEYLDYMNRYFSSFGCLISSDAAKELINRIGDDYGRFLNEIDKLSSYANGENISLSDVKRLVSPKEEDDAFSLSNALIRGDIKKALEIYRQLKIISVDEVRLIGMLSSQFRFMDMVLYLDNKGLSSSSIARELSSSPFRVDITLRNLYGVKKETLANVSELLYKADKDILSGRCSGQFAFERFLANFNLK